MLNIINWISLIMGINMIVISLIGKTKDIQSAVMFKVIPTLGGICIILSMLNTMGFIRIF